MGGSKHLLSVASRFAPILLLLLLLPLVVAEDACVTSVGGDYSCLAVSSYSGTDPFSTYCLSIGGTVKDTNSPECRQVCCCNQASGEPADPTPVSESYCAALFDDGFGTYLAQDDCIVGCGGSTGSTGDTYTVQGIVYDAGDPDGPARLDQALIQFPAGNQLVTVYTTEEGEFTLNNVPNGIVNFKASKVGCGQEQRSEDVQADISDLDFNLNCQVGDCAVEAVNDTTVTPIAGEPKVRVEWTASTCTNTQGHIIYRCIEENCQRVGFVPQGEGNFVDVGAPAETDLCYRVKVLDETGSEIDQIDPDSGEALPPHCLYGMNEYCMQGGATRSTCFNEPESTADDEALKPQVIGDGGDLVTLLPFHGAATCDPSTNRLKDIKNCQAGGANKFCYYTSTGQTGCRSPQECEDCNGLFGWFVDIAARVTGGTSCANLAGCILDNEGYPTDTFGPCANISSCYDYRTPEACNAGSTTDTCQVSSQGCQWYSLPGLEELGKGVCVPKGSTEGAPCESCEDIFGFCNVSLCDMISGSCYWNTEIQWEGVEPPFSTPTAGGQCVSKENMACSYYDDEVACIGASQTAVTVDATYDDPTSIDGVRTSGTHQLTVSDDSLHLGTCSWESDAGGSRCVKDANNRVLLVRDNIAGDDCFERDPAPVPIHDCFRDNTPPETTLPFVEGSYVDAAYLRNVAPIVRDEEYGLLDPLESAWFCINKSGTSCYPKKRYDSLLPDEVGVAPYTIYYYSEDPAGNLEVVKSINVNVYRDSSAVLATARLIENS